jgi:hypothetical protein
VDAWLGEPAAQDLVLDVVQADGPAARPVPPGWKNCPSRVFHTDVIGYSAAIAWSVKAL